MSRVALLVFTALASACAPADGIDLCDAYPDACDDARAAWERSEGLLSKKQRQRLRDLRVLEVGDTADQKYCARRVAACSGFDGNLLTTSPLASETPMIYLHELTLNAHEVLVHEIAHHLMAAGGRGWGGGQCWDPEEDCDHVGAIWDEVPMLGVLPDE